MTIRLAETFMDDIDAHAEQLGMNRSDYIREACRQKLQREMIDNG